jgi:acetylornithine deacetylase
MTDLTATVLHLARLVAHPTISSEPNLALIDEVAGHLADHGARIEILPDPTGQKANLWASFGPDAPGGLVLSAHSDVVPVEGQHWHTDPFVLTEVPDGLAARGACDMKGFLACLLAKAPEIAAAARHRPVHIALTHDEEVGCHGARALCAHLAARGAAPALCIVGEPTLMQVIDGHKGCFEYHTRFTGLAGHGSAPDLGVNAIAFAVRYAAKLMELAAAFRAAPPPGSRFDPPWTTINLGRLNGGFAPNVIPEEADLGWEMRPVRPGDAEFVKDTLAAFVEGELLPEMRRVHPGAGIVLDVEGEVCGLDPQEPNPARTLAMELTGANGAGTVAFGTEAGLFQSIGCATVVCGPGSIDQAHKADEWIAVDQLTACLSFLDRLNTRLASGRVPG